MLKNSGKLYFSYSEIYLNKYGCISLGSPSIFNDHKLVPVIAPFYSDITTTIGSDIFYREEINSAKLIRIKEDVNLIDLSFDPKWALIVTWYQVSLVNGDTNKKNTFQTVLTTNGTTSYVIFNYGKSTVSSNAFVGYQSKIFIKNSSVNKTGQFIFNLDHMFKVSDIFHSFGSTAKDSTASKNDEGNIVFNASTLFPYFGSYYKTFFINTNGFISLKHPNRDAVQSLPSAIPFISVFNTDLSTQYGDIFFREEINSSELIKIKEDINLIDSSFDPFWALVVTWYKVTGYGIDLDKTNTFQLVLTTNGQKSFAIFNYDELMFYQSDYYDDLAQAGINSGNEDDFFMFKESATSDILNLTKMSNVNKKGKFVFLLNIETINKLKLEQNFHVNYQQELAITTVLRKFI